MLEPAVLLDVADETGLRLCDTERQPGHPFEDEQEESPMLLAQLAPGCRSADGTPVILCCRKDGTAVLYERKRDAKPLETYELKFQMVTSKIAANDDGRNGAMAPSPPVRPGRRWTNLEALPQRPGEFLFSIQHSNQILITSIPGFKSELGTAMQHRSPGSYLHGSLVLAVGTHSQPITRCAVDKGGDVLVSGDAAGNIRVWPLTWACLGQEFLGGGGAYFGTVAATFGSSEEAGRWRPRPKPTSEISAHEGAITALVHVTNESGRIGRSGSGGDGGSGLFASGGGESGIVKIWMYAPSEAAQGESTTFASPALSSAPRPAGAKSSLDVVPILELPNTPCVVTAIAASDGFCAVGTEGGTLYLWTLPTAEDQDDDAPATLIMVSNHATCVEYVSLVAPTAPVLASQNLPGLLVCSDDEGAVRMYRSAPRSSTSEGSAMGEEKSEAIEGDDEKPWPLTAECFLNSQVILSGIALPDGDDGDGKNEGLSATLPSLVLCSTESVIREWPLTGLPTTASQVSTAPRPPAASEEVLPAQSSSSPTPASPPPSPPPASESPDTIVTSGDDEDQYEHENRDGAAYIDPELQPRDARLLPLPIDPNTGMTVAQAVKRSEMLTRATQIIRSAGEEAFGMVMAANEDTDGGSSISGSARVGPDGFGTEAEIKATAEVKRLLQEQEHGMEPAVDAVTMRQRTTSMASTDAADAGSTLLMSEGPIDSIGGDESAASAPSQPYQPQPPPDLDYGSDAMLRGGAELPTAPPAPPQGSLAHAAMQSTIARQRMHNELLSEEFDAAVVPVTDEERKYAAHVPPIPLADQGRYGDLASLDPSLPPVVKVKKQVDPRWVSQLRDCRLTDDDYYLPEPDPRQGFDTFSLDTTKEYLADCWAAGSSSSSSSSSRVANMTAASNSGSSRRTAIPVALSADSLAAASSLIAAEHSAGAFRVF